MDDDGAATQRLLDELTRLDAPPQDAPSSLPPVLPPVLPRADDVDFLLADLLPRSPTAQFHTFFASEGDAAAAPVEELLDFDLDQLVDEDQVASARQPPSAVMPLKKNKVPRRSPAYDSNRARNQRRHEIAYLRSKVADLESELARARAVSNHKTKLAVAWSDGSIAHQQPTRRGVDIWEQIAGRQLEERRRAERDNGRLRAALELQLKVAKSLQMILNKPSLTKSLDDISRTGVAMTSTLTEATMDAPAVELLQKLLLHVEQIYAQTDALVREGDAPGIRTASNASLAEIFVTDVMPFSLEAASKAAWSYFSYKKNYLPVPSRHYYERHDVDNVSGEDTVLESSTMERSERGISLIVNIKQALRRYVERDRVVIAWSAVSQSVEINGQPFTGCDLREWGCMVLRPATPSERRETDDALTVLRSCFFIAPDFRGGDVAAAQLDVGHLTECILAFTTTRMSTWRQRIENILLDEQHFASREGLPNESNVTPSGE